MGHPLMRFAWGARALTSRLGTTDLTASYALGPTDPIRFHVMILFQL